MIFLFIYEHDRYSQFHKKLKNFMKMVNLTNTASILRGLNTLPVCRGIFKCRFCDFYIIKYYILSATS